MLITPCAKIFQSRLTAPPPSRFACMLMDRNHQLAGALVGVSGDDMGSLARNAGKGNDTKAFEGVPQCEYD